MAAAGQGKATTATTRTSAAVSPEPPTSIRQQRHSSKAARQISSGASATVAATAGAAQLARDPLPAAALSTVCLPARCDSSLASAWHENASSTAPCSREAGEPGGARRPHAGHRRSGSDHSQVRRPDGCQARSFQHVVRWVLQAPRAAGARVTGAAPSPRPVSRATAQLQLASHQFIMAFHCQAGVLW
jgi:hypothetical protein